MKLGKMLSADQAADPVTVPARETPEQSLAAPAGHPAAVTPAAR